MTQATKTPVEKVKIVKSEVVRLLEEGKNRQELADHFGMPVAQMKKAMIAMKLTHKKAKKVTFEIIDDLATETTDTPVVEAVVTEEAKPTKNVEVKAEKKADASVVERF
jgi:hypothetical protein